MSKTEAPYNNLNYFVFRQFSDADRVQKQANDVYEEQGYLTLSDIYCLINKKELDIPDIYKKMGWTNIDYTDITQELETKYYNNYVYNSYNYILTINPFVRNIENIIKERKDDFKWKQKYLLK